MDRYFRHPSPPARWSGTDLVPIQSAGRSDVEVWAGWIEDDIAVWEAFAATPAESEHTFTLRSVPAYAYGLNYGDSVECVASDEVPRVISRVTDRGGQATFRIWLGTRVDQSAWRPIAESYAQRGCVVDVVTSALMALSCAARDCDAIREMLEEDAIRTGLMWESGARPR